MQEIYAEPVKAELITERLKQMREAGVTVAGSLSPQRTKEFAKTVVDAGVDMFVIRGTTVSAEHVSSQAEPLNLKEFIYELRSEEHTSELQSLMRNSYAVFCLKKKIRGPQRNHLRIIDE